MAFNPPVKISILAGKAGCYKSNLPPEQLLVRGIMAGIYIAMGAALCTVCGTGFTGGFKNLIAGAVFPVGLIAIVLTGAELFTGDCMLVPVACLQGKSTLSKLMKVWFWSYLGNLIGSLIYAYIMYMGPFVTGGDTGLGINDFGINAINIAVAKTLTYKETGLMGMWSCFLKGIGCNYLVNIAILLALSSDDMVGKFFGIWFPIMAFVSSGFEHCVANMYFLPVGIMLLQKYPAVATKIGGLVGKHGTITWGDMWLRNLIPATIGNIVGGAFFVGCAYCYIFKKEIPPEELAK
jgi:formate/nitrite transporter